jgi:DNA repair photolyase
MDTRSGAAQRGRGAVSNAAGRFEASSTSVFDDGWGSADEDLLPFPTVVQPEDTRRILSSNTSPDLPFNRSINPYKGCEHGCIYCFARPTHAFLGLSPGLDFETKIFSKPKAADLLRKELNSRSYRPEVIVLGANTDPYQPAEERLGISRQILEVLDELGHPVSIITKSTRILRDRDILGRMARRGLVHVHLSVTSLDPALARRMEPRAASPARRIAAIAGLHEADVPVSVLSSPMIPALNDSELEAILEASAKAGAVSAGYILLRLPREVADLFSDWLEHHYPDRKDHVLDLLRSTRDGALYRPEFGQRMAGTGPYADLLRRRFTIATRRFGLQRSPPPLRFEHFTPSRTPRAQLTLF